MWSVDDDSRSERGCCVSSERTCTMPILRVARPTDDIEALLPFYRDGLELWVLGQFEDHAGFDGIMLGRKGAPYHLEFTRARNARAGRAPTDDNLLIFYVPQLEAWTAATSRMHAAGFRAVPSRNPYWNDRGSTYEDPDGYRVVIARAAWTL